MALTFSAVVSESGREKTQEGDQEDGRPCHAGTAAVARLSATVTRAPDNQH